MKNCNCFFCKNNDEFDMPIFLLDQIKEGNVVLFAGAGISTESEIVLPYSLYDDVADDLELSEDNEFSFPELMTQYTNKPNGRISLLKKIKKRFDYISSFPDLYKRATQFHRELSTIFPIQNIITTNWDDYFEKECNAIPFVTDKDFALWEIEGRKVFKLHGSINNLGSLVINLSDYEKCYKELQEGGIGAHLKLILMTSIILYVGYSFTDDDFLRIHSLVKEKMGDLLPQAYIVTIDKDQIQKFNDLDLITIFTDATYFLKGIKRHLVDEKVLLPDDVFQDVCEKLEEIKFDQHLVQMRLIEFPEIIYTLSYQDGLRHSFERMLELKKSGYYSNPYKIFHVMMYYEELKKVAIENNRYHDVAYIEGYVNGLLYLQISEKKEREIMPTFYLYGNENEITDLETFSLELEKRDIKMSSPEAYFLAVQIIDDINNDPDITIHHPPYL